MSRFFVTPDCPDGWKEGLAKPSHWKPGYSAHSLAHSWHPVNAFPVAVASVFARSQLGELEFLVGIPEYQVALPGGDTASQTDLFVLARTRQGEKVAIAVEGKAEESFGDSTIDEWRLNASDDKKKRLEHLLKVLELTDDAAISSLRYQLFHRTASALMEAKRLHAPFAVMLVHSFSRERKWWSELAAFVTALGSALPEEDAIISCQRPSGRALYIGWVSDRHPEVVP